MKKKMKLRLFLVPLILFFAINVNALFQRVESGHFVTHTANSLGCSWGDLNGDCYPDLFVSNFNGNNCLYLSNGDGTFTHVATSQACSMYDDSIIATIIDINSDNRNDIIVGNESSQPNEVYLQDANGNFIADTTSNLCPNTSTYSIAWSDMNSDGNLDVFLGSWTSWVPNKFFLGSSTSNYQYFDCPPANYTGSSYGANWLDLNSDGVDDLFILNEDEASCIYYNNDGEGFTQHTGPHVILDNVPMGNSATWGDLNNDGFLDVYITGIYNATNHIFYYQGNGIFTQETELIELIDGSSYSRACSIQDFDNNGWLDIYVLNYTENSLFLNNGDGTYHTVTDDVCVMDNEITVAVASADCDMDGDMDLYLVNGTGNQNNSAPNTFYENVVDNGNNWLNVLLTGKSTWTIAVGAEVRLFSDLDGDGHSEWQMRKIMVQTSRNSQDDSVCHFGLGTATVIDSLIVTWPDGNETIITDIDANNTIFVTESGGIPSRLMLGDDSVHLGDVAEVPLSIFNLNEYLSSLDVYITYPEEHLQFEGVSDIYALLDNAAWNFTTNVQQGIIHLSGYGNPRLINLGQICKLNFTLLTEDYENNLIINSASYNGSSTFGALQNGFVYLDYYFPGDSNLDFAVTDSDVELILEECVDNAYFIAAQRAN
ncbi:MAG: CRTAC1 family protein, partial [Candidatus Cloacimonetes bacterium]|nr:CRTAC1 family protein [Candidatus Cloacimonadota bacterium]